MPFFFGWVKCDNFVASIFQKAYYGTLHEYFLNPQNGNEHDKLVRKVMFEVTYTIACIQQKDKYFTHNDLHIGNVLLDVNEPTGYAKYETPVGDFYVKSRGVRTVMADFGFSSITGKIDNFNMIDFQLGDPFEYPLSRANSGVDLYRLAESLQKYSCCLTKQMIGDLKRYFMSTDNNDTLSPMELLQSDFFTPMREKKPVAAINMTLRMQNATDVLDLKPSTWRPIEALLGDWDPQKIPIVNKLQGSLTWHKVLKGIELDALQRGDKFYDPIHKWLIDVITGYVDYKTMGYTSNQIANTVINRIKTYPFEFIQTGLIQGLCIAELAVYTGKFNSFSDTEELSYMTNWKTTSLEMSALLMQVFWNRISI